MTPTISLQKRRIVIQMPFHNKYHKIPFFFLHVIITYFAERQIPSAGMVKKKTCSGWLQMRRRYGFCFSLKPAFRLWAASWRSLDDSQRHTRAISFQLTHVTSGMVTVWGPAQIRKTKPVWRRKGGGGGGGGIKYRLFIFTLDFMSESHVLFFVL